MLKRFSGALLVLALTTLALAQSGSIYQGARLVIERTGAITLQPKSGQGISLAGDTTIAATKSLAYSSTNYSGTSSFQPVGVDLNLAAAAGSTDGKFLSPVMGNIFGTNLSKAGNYIGGVIGHYNIAGTNAATYPSGAVLGGIGDGTTTAKGAFVAYIDGDSALTTAGAAFKVMSNNSTAGSKFTYGLDLFDAAHDGFNAVSYTTADMRFSGGATLTLLSATASLDFAAWAGNDCQTLTIPVTNAADGNPVEAGIPDALASVADVVWSEPWVSGAGVVSVRGCKVAAGASADPAAATVRATVFKP